MSEAVYRDAVLLETLLPSVMRVLFRHEAEDPLGHLTTAQLRMVRALVEDRTTAELSTGLSMTPSAVSQTIHRLEGMGLIERRQDNHDRRVHQLGLSKLGERLLRERQALRVERARQVLENLPDPDRQILLRSLSQLVEASEPLRKPGDESLTLVAELEQTLPAITPYSKPR